MDFYLGLIQIIGVHTLLGLSAYCVLLTGQVSLAQAGFFAIGAYVAGNAHGPRTMAADPSPRRLRCCHRRRCLRRRFPCLARQGPDARGRDRRIRRSRAAFLLQLHLSNPGGKSPSRTTWRRRFPPDPLFSAEWLVDLRRHAVHLGGGGSGHGRIVVAGPFACRHRAARGRRGRSWPHRAAASTSRP